jgi:predicted amidophosphoribosyltransferase
MVKYDRINVTMPRDTADEIKRIAEERHMSVSGLVSGVCGAYVEHVRGHVCDRCHARVAPEARFCPQCGHPLTEEAAGEMDAAIREARASPEFRRLLELLRSGMKEP